MSNVDDMRLWANNFDQGQLGKGSLMRELQTPGSLSNGHTISYALGLELGTYRGAPTVGHNGSLFGYRTEILRLPQQDLTVVCLCNLSSVATGSLARKIADVYLPSATIEPSVSRPGSPTHDKLPDAVKFAGKYLDPYTHTLFSFIATNGDLMGWGTPLSRIDANSFHDLGTGILTFRSSDKDVSATLTMDGQAVFTGGRIIAMKTIPSNVSGTYSSPELGVSYRLSLDKDSLILRDASDASVTLKPLTETDFEAGDLGTVVFHRGPQGQVVGFRIFSGNVRGLIFEKTSARVQNAN